MQMKKSDIIPLVKIWGLLLLCATTLVAQSNKLRILQVETIVEKNLAGLKIVFAPFFTEKVTGTIQSGLPSMLEIELVIKNAQQKTIAQRAIFRRISYNIWEEKYKIDSPDTTQIFKDFASLQKACILLRTSLFLPQKLIYPYQANKIFIRARLRLISSSQSRKLAGWLDQSYQTRERISSDESSSGFRLNFSTLVSMFLGNSPQKKAGSDWQQFPIKFAEKK